MKKIGLIVCTNRSARPPSSSSSFLQLTTFGTYSGAISQALSTSQIAVGGASTSAAILTSTVNGRSPRSAFTRISRCCDGVAVDPGEIGLRRGGAQRAAARAAPSARRAIARGVHHAAGSAITELRSVPIRVISISIVSPGVHPDGRLAAGADAARRAGHDDVAGLELRPRRAVLDELRHVEAQLADALVLHDRAVQARRQRELARIGDLVRRHEPGAERAARVEILARA